VQLTKEFLYRFLREQKLAVVSSLSANGAVESALVGIAVTGDLEIIFDTEKSSRKYRNILSHPAIAVVIGWENETTVQYEGIATELAGEEAAAFREIYFAAFPGGRERFEKWPGLVHLLVRPKWIRYSNFNSPPQIGEMKW